MSEVIKQDLYLVVGAGGTGSYFVPKLLNYLKYKADSGKPSKVMLVDGDYVEEKNLLRQGFYKEHLGQSKAEAIHTLYEYYNRWLDFNYKTTYIETVHDVLELVEVAEASEKYNDIYLVSCVDNNMARLRLTVALYLLRDKVTNTLYFVDSGNTEWTGQTTTTMLKKQGKTFFSNLHEDIDSIMEDVSTGGKDIKKYETLLGKELHPRTGTHIYSGIFSGISDVVGSLTKADFELSCDDIAESSPQNIGTNMFASTLLAKRIQSIDTFKGGEYIFNAQDNFFEEINVGVAEEEGYENAMLQILNYIKTPEGFNELFIPSHELDKRLYVADMLGSIVGETNEETQEEVVKEPVQDERTDIEIDVEDMLGEVDGMYTEELTEDEVEGTNKLSNFDRYTMDDVVKTKVLSEEETKELHKEYKDLTDKEIDEIISLVLTEEDTVGKDENESPSIILEDFLD